MRIIADFHIHSKYARATSPKLTIPNIAAAAKIKGINLIGTGDFTHPKWIAEIEDNLKLEKNGFYTLKSGEYPDVYFVPTAEVASIYTDRGKCRRIHTVIIAPTIEAVKKINQEFSKRANLYSDGRPITGIPVKEIVRTVLDIEPRSLIVPAHIWTPWFAVLGSKSGFDSVEECFEEFSDKIYAVETGLSSDPEMNWQLSSLDKYTLISNSDAHSLGNLGREANVFEIPEEEFGYDEIYRILKEKDQKRFKFTIEYFPEEGMYHFDGHRNCNVSMSPEQSQKINNICPVCGKEFTLGVLHRVTALADRPLGYVPTDSIGVKKLMPLDEIISKAIGVGEKSKAVQGMYDKFIAEFGAEYPLLLGAEISEIKKLSPRIAEAIQKVREEDLKIKPGYDGSYGEVEIFNDLK